MDKRNAEVQEKVRENAGCKTLPGSKTQRFLEPILGLFNATIL
jgi:hypothetical protein